MGGTGFEPVKAVPSDLQSDPFDRSGNPPELIELTIARTLRGWPFPLKSVWKATALVSRLRAAPVRADELAEGLEPTTC